MAQRRKRVVVTRRLWVRSPLVGVNYYLLMFLFLRSGIKGKSAVLSSATQHVMSRKFDVKWGTECLNTRFPLLNLGVQREAKEISNTNNI